MFRMRHREILALGQLVGLAPKLFLGTVAHNFKGVRYMHIVES
jgi:hypothetical protein